VEQVTDPLVYNAGDDDLKPYLEDKLKNENKLADLSEVVS